MDELVRETTGTKATAADLTIRFYAEAFEALKRWAESEEGTSGDAHENMRSASKEWGRSQDLMICPLFQAFPPFAKLMYI